jgi:mRNA degradation ribonuclease J1/J2
MGWDPKNVPMLEDGSIVELDSRHEIIFWRKKIPMEQIWVDGMSIGALSSRAIQDRIQIGEEGVLIVNSKDGVVESRWLFFPDEIAASHTAISAEVKKLTSSKKVGDNDKNARDGLAKELGKMLNKVWGRSPVVVVL